MTERASEVEGRHRLFRQVTAVYWLEELADYGREEFGLDAAGINALSVIQLARQSGQDSLFRYFRLSVIVGVIIAAFGFVGSQVPKESFAAVGGS
jgi:hypothetical protein